ncbi:MAG: glycosyltransferase, partial [Candidatus Marinimicrobia bacterium]|nr:glycosyltransferase [Candidatus Neomarinimicrobiota bacterium]
MSAIHQLVAGYSHGDAISNEARVLRAAFRAWGHDADIFCEARRILPELRRDARDVAELPAALQTTDVILLHLSIGSAVNDLFPTLPGRRALLYHNMTPPEYLAAFNPQTAHLLARGREQLAQLAGSAELVLADSAYNAAELTASGYGPVQVLPLVLDWDPVRATPHRGLCKEYRDGLVNVIFVGRCVPNKRIEDLLALFHYYQRFVRPASRLIHVGSHAGLERYHALLLTQARDLQLQHANLLGAVEQRKLNAVYRSAQVFVSMSEHEGFCIPLLEAMACDVPVLAHAAAAVPETMAGAGVLFKEKRYDLLAEMVERLAHDGPLRRAVLAGQRPRLAAYDAERPLDKLRAWLT